MQLSLSTRSNGQEYQEGEDGCVEVGDDNAGDGKKIMSFSRRVEDLVEVVVSRLKIEAQLSRLGLVQFITSLHCRKCQRCIKFEACF